LCTPNSSPPAHSLGRFLLDAASTGSLAPFTNSLPTRLRAASGGRAFRTEVSVAVPPICDSPSRYRPDRLHVETAGARSGDARTACSCAARPSEVGPGQLERAKAWEKFRLGREQLKADLLGYEGALVVFRSRMEEPRMSEGASRVPSRPLTSPSALGAGRLPNAEPYLSAYPRGYA
jgi:hypothetical protein